MVAFRFNSHLFPISIPVLQNYRDLRRHLALLDFQYYTFTLLCLHFGFALLLFISSLYVINIYNEIHLIQHVLPITEFHFSRHALRFVVTALLLVIVGGRKTSLNFCLCAGMKFN